MTILDSMAIEFDIVNRSFKKISVDEARIDIHNKNKIYWIHCNLNKTEIFKNLTNKLHLPDDVIKLCNQEDIIPKVIDLDEALIVQIQCLLSTELNENNDVNFGNLVIYLTPYFCFTVSTEPLPPLFDFIESCQKSLRYAKTPCFILFLLLDNAINDYAKTVFNFELVSEQMDFRVRTTHKNIYNDVMVVKQQLMKIKRYTIAAREILMRISGRKIAVVSEQCRLSLYNLSNHSHLVVHEIDSIRDMLNGLLDQIENTLMQRMNETMRILTAFAAIFLPLTLITGIYGMNFHWMPELEWKYGYFYALSLIVLCAGIMLFIFKKMKWF